MKTQFFTGKGDTGESEVGKKKVLKSDPAVQLLGGLDELNSWLGFCRVEAAKDNFSLLNLAQVIKDLQQSLFVVQAEVAALAFGYPQDKKITSQKTKTMEDIIFKIDETLPPLKNFVIPGASELSARLDVARAIARRVERLAKYFNDTEKELSPNMLQFLNRLSSLLFALARYVNHEKSIGEEHPSYS